MSVFRLAIGLITGLVCFLTFQNCSSPFRSSLPPSQLDESISDVVPTPHGQLTPAPSVVPAPIHTSASCSQSDVQAAIDTAADGEIVQIPAGECIWNQSVKFCKSITLAGAGKSSTTIIADIGSSWDSSAIQIYNCNNKVFRITGFSLKSKMTGAYGLIWLWKGAGTTFRIDHMILDGQVSARAVTVQGGPIGVIDSNIFTNAGILVDGDTTGDLSWSSPMSFGTSNAIFVEDNLLTSTADLPQFDCLNGGRVVYRHNEIKGSGIFNHGYDSVPRSCLELDIYKNVMDGLGQTTWAIQFRGGTGVVYDNLIRGNYYSAAFVVTNYRSSASGYYPGKIMCDGTSADDQNQSPLDLNHGWPCRDQIGRGMGQASFPLYEWNNCRTSLGCANNGPDDVNILVQSQGGLDFTSAHIKPGRDFFTNTVMPGYVEFTYPHPLRSK